MHQISPELQTAYEETNYKIFLEEKEICLRVGEGSVEIDGLLENLEFNSYAFITAANPYSSLKSEGENRLKNLELEMELESKKYFYLRGIGESFDETWKEESFCVFGIDLQAVKKLAEEFLQNAFLYGMKNKAPEIIWCK